MQNLSPLRFPDERGLSPHDIACLFIGAILAVLGYVTIALFLDLVAQV